jgi:phosphoglycolate phosphatase
MSRRLVIFDCDGTLVDSQHVIVAAMEMAFAGAGLPAPQREAVLSIVGLSLPEAIWRVKLAHDIEPDEALLGRLLDGYRQAFGALRQDPAHDEPMFPGALEGVRALAARDGVLLGIATGKSRRGVDRLLARFGLVDCFSTIQTADDAPSKPHPAMIEQAMAEAGTGRHETLMVGDTSFDIEMARNAGVPGLGVAWGYHSPDVLQKAGAAAVAADFADLLAVIDGHMGAVEVAE